MDSIVCEGGHDLKGEVCVEGAKNSVLKLMAASILAPGAYTISNVPDISDVSIMAEVLKVLGAQVARSDHTLHLDTTGIESRETPYELVAQMRASIAVLGPLIARFGHAKVAMPGGCRIGSRPIDIHINGLIGLGVKFDVEHGFILASAEHGLVGSTVTLDFPSVGATENLLMAAVLAKGETIIENAAREPEIVDLANMLTEMGATVTGQGTPTIEVSGVEALHSVDHTTIGDRIEAATFLVAGALCRGPVTVRGFEPSHLEIVLSKLRDLGCHLDVGPDFVTVESDTKFAPLDIQTLPYPGFPTDVQAQFMVPLALANGHSVITENLFENRFMFADEIMRMGADVHIEGHHAFIEGVSGLSGAPVKSPDLRGGAALVLAGLVASGETVVAHPEHIDRGYERFVEKLCALGAHIRRTS